MMFDQMLPMDIRPSGPIRVLLVVAGEEDADLLRKRLLEDHEDISISLAPSFGAAVGKLKAESFDAAVIEHDLPDGSSFDLLGRVDIVSPQMPVLVLLDRGNEDTAVGIMKAGAADYVRRVHGQDYDAEVSFKLKEALNRYLLLEQVEEMVQQREQLRFIDTVRSTVANTKHEINNPLSIISGNAQLLLELAKIDQLGDGYIQPLADIEEASRRIAASLDKLEDLKDIISRRYLDEEETSSGLYEDDED